MSALILRRETVVAHPAYAKPGGCQEFLRSLVLTDRFNHTFKYYEEYVKIFFCLGAHIEPAISAI